MYDYSKKSTADGNSETLGIWHQAALELFSFSGKAVIDIGCGSGAFLKAIQPKAKQVLGIDPNPLNTEQLTAHGLPAVTGYLEEHVTNSQGYNVVTCFEVIEHLYSPKTLFETMHTLLPSDGTAIVSTPNAFHAIRALKFALMQEHHDSLLDPTRQDDPEHVRLWSASMLKRGLTQAGFSNVRVYGTALIGGRMRVLRHGLLVKYVSQHLIAIAIK